MPWSHQDYPVSMKNLPAAVRNKAVDIANALLKEKRMDEGIIIATAISRARDWAVNHNKSIRPKAGSRTNDEKHHGGDMYVIPHADGWAVKKEGAKKAEKIFKDKQDAVSHAGSQARKLKTGLTVLKRTGRVQKKISYNPNRKARKTH